MTAKLYYKKTETKNLSEKKKEPVKHKISIFYFCFY